MIWFEKDIEIRYPDTDQMGVVHHAVHPIYLELLRIRVCEALDAPYADIERQGFLFMVASLAVRYVKPIEYHRPIYVRGGLEHLHRRFMKFFYEIRRRGDDALLATAETTHVVTSREGKPVSMPPEIMDKLKRGLAA